MANIYDKGDLVRISVTFTVSGVDTDPTTVALKIKDPEETITTYTYAASEIIKDAVGKYHKDIPINASGRWYYRWEGTGAVVTAGESYLQARQGAF